MTTISARLLALTLGTALLTATGFALAWDLSGTKMLTAHTRDGTAIPIGTVTFQPRGEQTHFSLELDHRAFKDFFLSMREFKCLEGQEEIQCHVPYPYPNPATINANDFAWLEHALLFLYKVPSDFGARLWNGIYYRMTLTEQGLIGLPEAVDLNLIAAPPANTSIAPFRAADRSEIAPDSRWIRQISIK